MSSESTSAHRDQLHKDIGAVDILVLLREEIEQWQEEAQDSSKQEALDNVLAHIHAMETEYKGRLASMQRVS